MPPVVTLVYTNADVGNFLDLRYDTSGWSTRPKQPLRDEDGLPSSSRTFEPLLSRLSGQFHFVAPDYPGFGHSDAPDTKQFAYTFDHIASVITHFTEALGLSHYTCRITEGRSVSAWP
jgi:hypothetical protein